MRGAARRIALAVVAAACLAGCAVQVGRASALDGAGTVEVVLDYRATLKLCNDIGADVDAFLGAAAAAGATSLALPGRTPGMLALEGRASVVDGGALLGLARAGAGAGAAGAGGAGFAPRGDRSYVLCAEPGLAREVAGAAIALGYGDTRLLSTASGWAVEVATSRDDLLRLPLGFPPDVARPALRHGLTPVAIIDPPPRPDPACLAAATAQMRDHGMRLALFAGEDDAGYLRSGAETGRILGAAGVTVAVLENVDQPGVADAARAAPAAVRAHLIYTSEPHSEFTLAARDRGVRVFWVRPFFPTPRDTADSARAANIALIADLSQRLSAAGLGRGAAHGFERFSVMAPAAPVLGLGAVAGALLLAGELFTRARGRGAGERPRAGAATAGAAAAAAAVVVVAAAGAAVAALPGVGGEAGRQAVALLAAVVFPALGVARALALRDGPAGRGAGRGLPAPALAVCGLLLATAWSLAGALIIASLLGDTAFALNVAGFRGVKVAALAPLVLIGVPWWLDLAGAGAVGAAGDGQRPTPAGTLAAWRRLGGSQATVWFLATVLAVAGTLAFYLARTGHTAGAPVSGAEQLVRLFLSSELLARPRFKEFLVGHPALLLGLYLYARGAADCPRGRWITWLLLVVGVVGQASIVNSFCHLHAPLAQSAVRTGFGLALGGALGLLAIGAWSLGSRLVRKGSKTRCSGT